MDLARRAPGGRQTADRNGAKLPSTPSLASDDVVPTVRSHVGREGFVVFFFPKKDK